MKFREDDERHGTYNFYIAGCRCEKCTTFWNEYCLLRRLHRTNRGLDADDPRHGTANGYINWGCRCDPCRVAGLGVMKADGRAVGQLLTPGKRRRRRRSGPK